MPAFDVVISGRLVEGGSGPEPGRDQEFLTQWDDELLAIIAEMTLDEKIGQMVQAEFQNVNAGDVRQFFLGSILSGGTWSPPTNSPEGWAAIINNLMQESLDTRMGIPLIVGLDSVHGSNKVMNAVMLPHNIGLGAIAMGNLELGIETGYKAGLLTAEETRAIGVRWTFAPCIGNAEDMRWGRVYECYSEDVEIVTVIGAAVTRGLQDGGVAACLKHFIGEGQTIMGTGQNGGTNRGNAILSDEEIRSLLPPYQAGLDVGAATVMPSFSSVNGILMHQHGDLMQKLLKDEMGFEGFVISDWAAVNALTGGTYRVQLANAVNAGIDMIMATGGGRARWVDTLRANVQAGTISEDRIDDAVLRILRAKKSIDLWEEPMMTFGEVGTLENRAIARKMVADSLVLLRNENNLMSRMSEFTNILVTGQGDDNIGMQCGGWTINHQGSLGANTRGVTILDGIRTATTGRATVTYSATGTSTGTHDLIIAVIGENPYAESNGDFTGATIPLRAGTAATARNFSNGTDWQVSDVAMLNNVYTIRNTGVPLIVIMLSGRPMSVGSHHNNWDAFIAAWLPGSEAGDGIADVLFGERDFVGKTPYTWRETFPDGQVLYPFGFGLRKNN
jgi:beta-glucosidase